MALTVDETTDSLVDGRICAFDSNDQGEFEFTGTYTDTLPTGIEARCFNRSDSNATIQINGSDWNVLTSGTISGGNFSGRLTNIPKTSGWLGFELRKANDQADTVTTTNNIGVGFVVAGCGQSHIDRFTVYLGSDETPHTLTRMCHWGSWSDYQGYATPDGYGVVRLLNLLQTAFDCPVCFLDYGVSGSALLEENDDSTYGHWVDTDDTFTLTDNRFKTLYDDRLKFEPLDRIKFNAVVWIQGHSDADTEGNNVTDYKTKAELLFSWFRNNTYFGNTDCSIYISGVNHSAFLVADLASSIRDTEIQLCNEQTYTFYACNPMDIDLDDGVHHYPAGIKVQASRIAQAICVTFNIPGYNGYRGPIPIRTSFDIENGYSYIHLILDNANDITPATDIDSFEFYHDEVWNSYLGTKIDANTIRFSTDVNTANITDCRCLYGAPPTLGSLVKDSNNLPIEPRLSILPLGWFINYNNSGIAESNDTLGQGIKPSTGNEPVLINDRLYRFEYEIINYTSGNLYIEGFCTKTQLSNNIGTHWVTLMCNDNSQPLWIKKDDIIGYVGQIDNFALYLI